MSSFSKRVVSAAPPVSHGSYARSGLLGLALAAVLGAGCSAPDADTSSKSDSPSVSEPARGDARRLDPREPGASVVCGMTEGRNGLQPELYMLYAMNWKLRHYPEFASAIGMDLVSDCESARQFATAYGQYVEDHPGFDADEPVGDSPPEEAAPPPEDTSSVEVQKIYLGTGAVNHAVVKIDLVLPSEPHESWKFEPLEPGQVRMTSCTGTLINKNWILTAAHCVSFAAIYHCLKDPTLPLKDCTPQWSNYARYTISRTRPDDAGVPHVWQLPNEAARGYVYPGWLGQGRYYNNDICKPAGDCKKDHIKLQRPHDLALMHLSSLEDKLAPTPELGLAKRVSIVPPVASWPLTFYGYGKAHDTVENALRQGGPGMAFSVPTDPAGESNSTIEGRPTSPLTPYPCKGDSGGPLMRTGLELETNDGVEDNLEAIVAVLSGDEYIDPKTCKPDPPDAPVKFFWVRTDTAQHRTFIENTLRLWYPYQGVKYRQLSSPPTSSGAQVQELWGKPCQVDVGCAATEICWHPADYFNYQSRCQACEFEPAGGCGCIVGQCVTPPRPRN